MAMQLDELPDGWTVKPLRDCVAPKEHWNLTRDPRQRIRYVELAGIDNERGVIIDSSDIEATTAPSRAKKVIRVGDVIFATTRPNLKNIAIVPPELNGEICSTGFCVLRPKKDAATSGWIFGIVRSDWFISQVIRHDEKNAYPSVSDDEVLNVEIPVPPLPEQRRIVARVEALTCRLDQARQARQAALAEAETLLSSAVSKAQKRFRRAGKSTVLGEILTDLQYGTSAKASVHPVGTPVIRMGNIQNGRILTDNLKYLQLPSVEFKRYRLDQGDVLINRTNSAELVGKTGLFNLASDYVFASYLIRLRVNRSIADPAFVNYAINSDDGLAYLRSQGKDAIGQTNINTKQIRKMPITIPPLPAQRELVARLDAMREKLDELQRLQREVEAELASFTPALLAKAFRGGL
jgi:type I restriction enzyme S subunit